MRGLTLLAVAAGLYGQEPMRLSLADAESLAMQNNPAVSASRYNAEAAAEVPKEVRSGLQPLVFGSVTGAGASDGSRIAAGALNNPVIYDRLASGVGVSQLVTDFGRTRNLVDSAKSRALAQNENARKTRADVLLDVDRSYFAVLRAQAVLQVARETVTARQLVADQVSVLAKNALKSNLDVSFANVNLAEAQLLLSSADNDLRSSLAEFATAIGMPNERNFALADEATPDAPPVDPRELIAGAIRNRPELASLRYEHQAAGSFAKAERALLYPSVSTVAMIGVVPAGVSQLPGRYGAVGLNVNIPIFNGGLFGARRTEAELRERSVRDSLKDSESRVVRDVDIAYRNAATAYERLGLTAKLLAQATLASELAQSRYDLGLSSIVELSQAQLNLTSAQIASASARFEYQQRWRILRWQVGDLR